MARFRAYASDSGESDSASEPETESKREEEQEAQDESESEQESTGSDSSDDVMREDDLLPSQSRTRKANKNAFVEDEDGEIRYAHEVEDGRGPHVRVSPASSRPSPPPRTTIIPWAQQIGVDAQKMHVMQTSLFRMPEEAAALKILNQTGQPSRTILRVPLQQLNRKHSRDSDGDGLRIDSRERASFAHDIEPPIYRPSRKYARVGSSESAVKGNEGAAFDAGLSLGRSFRVGWGPGGTLVHLGSLCGPSSTPKSSANSSTINKTIIPLFSAATQASSRSAKLLQHHLSNSPITPDEDGVPFASPSRSLNFSSFTSLFPSADRSYEASLFRLGQALFDEIDLRLGKSVTTDIRNRVYALRRKAALSTWLEDAVNPAVEADLRADPSADVPNTAFTLLTGNQTEKAVKAATDGGYFKLATLISQAGGDWEFREDLKEQSQIWKDQRIDAHIDGGVRKIYALLAGVVDSVVEGSKGGGLEKCSDVDVLKGLDWKRIFGLHLWFSEPIDATIAQAFQAYDQLTRSAPRRVARPLPWYSEQSSSPSQWNVPSASVTPDGLFSLIRLHAEPARSLSHTLTPLSFSPSPVDYTLPWHLYIILSRCMRIRDFADRADPDRRSRNNWLDSSLAEDEESEETEGHSPSADLLTSSYAFQLEELGLIQEAVFVLLHIEGSAGREKAIKDLLTRSAPKLDEWMTRGIVGSLKIPMEWVNEAKGLYALDNGEIYDAYMLFLSAGSYNLAHDLAVLELAPEAVLRRDLELLKSLFNKFVGRQVDGWHLRGKVFLDYVQIMTRLPELLEAQAEEAVPDAHQRTEIEELSKSVPKLIGILPDVLRDANDVRRSAALAEMVSELVAQVDKVQPLVLSKVQPLLGDESTRLEHVQTMSFARFMDRISL